MKLARHIVGEDVSEDEPLISEGDSVNDPALAIARGDSLVDDGESKLPSELPGIDDDEWTQFVTCMATGKSDGVSPSNALGLFEMMPRRLADLGLVKRLARSKPAERTIWVAVFVPPMTSDKFLRNPQVQYRVFSKSMKDYSDRISGGEIVKPAPMSLSGALAILHRAGPKGLETWATGERFPSTQASYDRVAGVF